MAVGHSQRCGYVATHNAGKWRRGLSKKRDENFLTGGLQRRSSSSPRTGRDVEGCGRGTFTFSTVVRVKEKS
jgi:hypothetical protein